MENNGDINPNPGPTTIQNNGTSNIHHVKKVYERSELLSLQSTSPALPMSLQTYIKSLEIPTRKHRITHRGQRKPKQLQSREMKKTCGVETENISWTLFI